MNDSGIDASYAEGEHSQFDVVSDGTVVFSKQRQGRFPEPDEILSALTG